MTETRSYVILLRISRFGCMIGRYGPHLMIVMIFVTQNKFYKTVQEFPTVSLDFNPLSRSVTRSLTLRMAGDPSVMAGDRCRPLGRFAPALSVTVKFFADYKSPSDETMNPRAPVTEYTRAPKTTQITSARQSSSTVSVVHFSPSSAVDYQWHRH